MKTLGRKTMKSVKLLSVLLVFVVINGLVQQAAAQTYTLQSYTMKISGTSNVHDWTMKALNAKCNASFTLKANSPLAIAALNTLEFSLPVKGLKSESDLMDSRTYSTLKSDKNPTIIFKMTSADVTNQGNNKYAIRAKGVLTFGGGSREIILITNGVLNADQTINVTGKHKIKMSEWGIKPPSFMLGVMKVGNEVTVDFNLKFKN